MKKFILLFALIPFTAQAEWSIAGGADIAFDAGKPYAEVRYFGEDWPYWSTYVGTENTVGFAFHREWGKGESFGSIQTGWGVEYANPGTDIVDTEWGYELRIEYLFPQHSKWRDWSIAIKHRSNCQTVCDNDLLRPFRIGDDESENSGYNYLILRKTF